MATGIAGSGAGWSLGPFLAPSGAYYALATVNNTTDGKWYAMIYKASAPTGTWTNVGHSATDAAQVPNGKGTTFAVSGVLIGSRIFICHGSGGALVIRYFDTATDSWMTGSSATVNGGGTGDSISNTQSAGYQFGLCKTENGDLGAAWISNTANLNTDNIGITRYPAAGLAGATPFGSNVSASALSGFAHASGGLIVAGGAGGRIHVLAATAASSPATRLITMNGGGTLNAQTLGSSRMTLAMDSFVSGGTTKVAALVQGSASSSVYWLTFDSADVPSVSEVSLLTAYTTTRLLSSLGRVGGDWWIAYNDSTSTAKIRTVADDGSSLGTANAWSDKALADVSPLKNVTISSIDYVAMVFTGSGGIFYDQFSISGPPPSSLPWDLRPKAGRVALHRSATR